MPYVIRKLPKQDLYRVYNAKTKEVYSYGTTLENAKKQITLLNMIDAGVPITKGSVASKKQGKGLKGTGVCCCPDDCECMEGGTIAEYDKVLRPFINRIGSKVSLLRDIISVIPPHKTYVEAFAGGGSIFWNKEPAEKSVLNDLDKDVIQSYKDIKKVPLSADLTSLDNKPIASVQAFVDKVNSKSSPRDRLLKIYKVSKGTFNSKGEGKLYKNVPISIVAKNLQKYKDLLKHTTITNKDYEKVVREYDSPDTFFLLDPPYEESEVLYKDGVIDYEKMRDLLKSLKGKFLLTINDSKYIRDVFKGFNQKKVSVSNVSNSPYLETKGRKELFISNYPLTKQGKGVATDLFENQALGRPILLPEINSVEIILPTYLYKRLPDIQNKDGTTKPPPYRFRLVTPINKTRNIASRLEKPVVDVKRKVVEEPTAEVDNPDLASLPKLMDFSPADRQKIREYFAELKRIEKTDVKNRPNQPVYNKPRGFPVYMAENALKYDVPYDANTDTYGDNPKGQVAPKVKKPVGRPKVVKPPKEKKPRGRPKKQQFKEIILKDDEENIFINPEVVMEDGKDPFALSELSSLPSLAKDSSVSSKSKKSSSSKSSVSSEPSVSTAKSSKSSKSKKSIDTIDTGDMSLGSEDVDDFLAKYGIKGKGIENKISCKNIGMNKWVQYVKDYAAKKGIKFNEALKDPLCKAGYKSGSGIVSDVKKAVKSASKKIGLGIVDESVAQKKYISL